MLCRIRKIILAVPLIFTATSCFSNSAENPWEPKNESGVLLNLFFVRQPFVHLGPLELSHGNGFSLTALSNDELFIAGGEGSNRMQVFSLLDDESRQASGDIVPAGGEYRARHSATRLADGDVLICGGEIAPYTYTDTCLIYNPVSNLLQSAASMNAARFDARGFLLDDGRVLLVGTPGSSGTVAEIYDPDADSWTPIVDPRPYWIPHPEEIYFSRTLQKVLLIAAVSPYSHISRPDLNAGFTLSAGGWQSLGEIDGTIVRYGLGNSMLRDNGDVLLPTGCTGDESCRYGFNKPSRGYFYSAAEDAWSQQNLLPRLRYQTLSVTMPNGDVLLFGGEQETDSSLSYSEIVTDETGDVTLMTQDSVGSIESYDPFGEGIPEFDRGTRMVPIESRRVFITDGTDSYTFSY